MKPRRSRNVLRGGLHNIGRGDWIASVGATPARDAIDALLRMRHCDTEADECKSKTLRFPM